MLIGGKFLLIYTVFNLLFHCCLLNNLCSGPCKAIAPKVAEFEQKYGGAKFFKVNVGMLMNIKFINNNDNK